jgi:hypothetical protein
MGKNFVKDRQEELSNFLMLIVEHKALRFDTDLHVFLTLDDSIEAYRNDPSAFQKVLGLY